MYPLCISLFIAFGTVFGSLLVGLPLAIILVKADFPGRRILKFLYLVPLFIPPAVMALAWMAIVGQIGFFYSPLGAIIMLTFCYFPFITLISSAGISTIGKDIEDAARLEYGTRGIITHVILPYASKYIIAAALFVFVLAVSNYEIPALLGVHTYPVEIFSAFSIEYDHWRAAGLALPLVLFCAGLIILAGWLMKDKDFITVTHDRQGMEKFHLNPAQQRVCLVYAAGVISIAVVLPLVVLVMKAGGAFTYVKAFSLIASELCFSLTWAVLAGLVIVFFSFIFAYAIERAKPPLKHFLYYLSVLPFALPGTVVGIMLIKTFNYPALAFIYTTPPILLIGYCVRFMPFTIRIIAAAIEHLDKSIEEEAVMVGARLRERLFAIVAPNCWQALIAAFAVSLILAIGELGMTVLVVPPGASPFILKIYNLMHYGANKLVAAQALILIVFMAILGGGVYMIYKKLKKVLFVLIVAGLLTLTLNGYCAENKHLYSTWTSLEADTMSSAWLIKRFIDKDAVFKFYPKGELIEEGIPFDVPESKYQRGQNESTFESLARMNNITDPKVKRMGKVIHDIEINYWNKRFDQNTSQVQLDINEILDADKDPVARIDKGIAYFDKYYKNIDK